MGKRVATTVTGAAVKRALAGFWYNIGIDIVSAVGLGVLTLMGTLDVSDKEFWIAVGLLILRTTVAHLANFAGRLKKPAESDVIAIEATKAQNL